MKYRAAIPFIDDMGSISPMIVSSSRMETKEENLLWHLNSMRDHDGLKPMKRIPHGVKFVRLED